MKISSEKLQALPNINEIIYHGITNDNHVGFSMKLGKVEKPTFDPEWYIFFSFQFSFKRFNFFKVLQRKQKKIHFNSIKYKDL